MFERFTDRARRVMALANQEALRLHHDYIGTEHILLGLVKDDLGLGAAALTSMDVTAAAVEHEIENRIRPGPDPTSREKLPQTPPAKKVIEYAIEEARSLRHKFVGTEHLLLALLRDPETVAGQALASLGVDQNRAREVVMALLTESDERTERPAPESAEAALDTGRASFAKCSVCPMRLMSIVTRWFTRRARGAGRG